MITGREGARTPSLDEVRQELRDAVLRIRARASVEQAMRSLLSRYDIDVDLEETTSNPD